MPSGQSRIKEDLTNKEFGCYTVLRLLPKRGRQGMAKWLCRCKCGAERAYCTGDLNSKVAKWQSCKKCRVYTGPNHPCWKGGKVTDRHGYVRVIPPGQPSRGSSRRVAEHRFVMETHLGRKLRRNENVHHKNGIRHDNRIENLELWAKSHPKGQRVTDLVAFARQVLADYSHEIERLS